MKLADFFDKYSKEDIKAHFRSYITDAVWEAKKELFLFHFVCSKEKALPRSFIDENLPLILTHTTKPEEVKYEEDRIFSQAIFFYPLGDELVSQYGDKIDWESISYRKDLTLEFFNAYKDKIKLKRITADLGEEFISEHLFELELYNLKNMNLTLEQAERLIKEKKAKVEDFWRQKFFTKDFALSRLRELQYRIIELNERFKFTFEEKLKLLKEIERFYSEDSQWNRIISEFMESGELTLEQQKEIKWYAWI